MHEIHISKGLDLPFKDSPNFEVIKEKYSNKISLDLSPFTHLHIKPKIALGDKIKKGETIAIDVHEPKRAFLSPFTGKLTEILRGDRRKITGLVIELKEGEEENSLKPIDLTRSKEALMEDIFLKGLSFSIRKRPFNKIITLKDFPRSIFIHTVVSAPYVPSFTHILKGNEKVFQKGIDLLSKFATVYLVANEEEFLSFENIVPCRIRGKHPIESPSIPIAALDPITSPEDVVWSINVNDVLHLGSMTLNGSMFNKKVISLAGDGFSTEERTLVLTNSGANLKEIAGDRQNLISGTPLTGNKDTPFLHDKDFCITSFKSDDKTEILPFVMPGFAKHTLTKTYLWGLIPKKRAIKPSYKLGGEERPFILKDGYQKALPIHIYIEPLLKALLAKDYDTAISLGFLDIDTEDLSIAEYLCPSKLPLMKIFEKGKNSYLALHQ